MEVSDKLNGYAGEWSEYIQEFFKIHVDFLKYELGEQLFIVASVLLSRLVSIFVLILALVFGSGALAFYLGHILGSLAFSFALVCLGYALIVWIIFRIKRTWVNKLTLAFLIRSVFNRRNLNLKTMKEYPAEFGSFLKEKEKIRLKKNKIDSLLHAELIHLLNEFKAPGKLSRHLIPFILNQYNQLSGLGTSFIEHVMIINANRKWDIQRILFNFLKSLFFRKTIRKEEEKYPLSIKAISKNPFLV
ncbi:MAG: hypothetical protein ABI761_07190 [Saprospiraceae bacterium]